MIIAKKGIIHRILNTKGSPHRIALGAAIGTFVAMTPTLGLQTILSTILALVLRANKTLSFTFIWISNVVTAVPIYLFNYTIGCWLLRKKANPSIICNSVSNAFGQNVGWMERMQVFQSAVKDICLPLWLGSLVVAAILGSLSYILIRYGITKYRGLL